jgi:hypothetical protein
LFQVFELGLLGIKAHLVDIAGQCRRSVHRAVSGKAHLRHSRAAGSAAPRNSSIACMQQIEPFEPPAASGSTEVAGVTTA